MLAAVAVTAAMRKASLLMAVTAVSGNALFFTALLSCSHALPIDHYVFFSDRPLITHELEAFWSLALTGHRLL
ncbi:MAG TPA: hypothetical protein V6C50_01120, partial [Crinalium sp.]